MPWQKGDVYLKEYQPRFILLDQDGAEVMDMTEVEAGSSLFLSSAFQNPR